MSKKEMLFDYLENHNGMITSKDCKTIGIPTIYLTRLENEGVIFRVEKGIYLSSTGDYDEYYFFQYRYPRTVFSYVSALYLQGFTDEIPQYFEITVPKGYRFRNTPLNLNIHTVSKEFVNLGVISVETPVGNIVKVHDFERILCDFILNRDKIDSELFVKTLQTYSNYSKKNTGKLYEYATKMNILDEVKRTLEVLL
ncbi:TPA: type IV toxin-antitoxin system AbiEi family antitoxin domain-containing protein [Streptococcus agalactiae]|uniref:AbiEi antitoxin N-terminal domain-containing protein n=1 Tax=Streptococcus agalactiae serotype III (strain NEM316) TaxID=211110 RepID=Q8E4P4_STRA3|nr:type IV toxin-antitoxin system AbiEi family antitoxin domain-containing protein [Streptococcus agalactiae]EPU25107.1 abortive phage infection protein [Streptococcus agalactiae LMG 14609]HEO2248835.1 type IV toxin-antitoxin system AbiEi family antitoxin domain-containing protein [Streptococcus agalactiae 515]ASA99188.1 abortive phage infection protein [Streptococcus agalactiae]EPT51396.1 abortive phage infection protein [Streptococcus agalactiae FSL F2-343]EPU23151.1 abortive phage infection